MRILDPFDEDDRELLEQISIDNDIPLRFLLKSEIKIDISKVEILFISDLENLEECITKELGPES